MFTRIRLAAGIAALLVAGYAGMASGNQCGFSKSGCLYGWHDCKLGPEHSGKHRCRQCGNRF